jgi:ATP-dependent Lon protease
MDRKIRPRVTGAFFIFVTLLVVCGKSPSISADEKEAFINTYVELTLAKIKYGNLDKQYQNIKKEIFLKNGTGEEFLNNFIDKISTNIEIQQEIYEEIANRLEKFDKISPDSLNRYFRNYNLAP